MQFGPSILPPPGFGRIFHRVDLFKRRPEALKHDHNTNYADLHEGASKEMASHTLDLQPSRPRASSTQKPDPAEMEGVPSVQENSDGNKFCSFMADVEKLTGRLGYLLSRYDESQERMDRSTNSPELNGLHATLMQSSSLLQCLKAPDLCEELEDVSIWLDNCRASLQVQATDFQESVTPSDWAAATHPEPMQGCLAEGQPELESPESSIDPKSCSQIIYVHRTVSRGDCEEQQPSAEVFKENVLDPIKTEDKNSNNLKNQSFVNKKVNRKFPQQQALNSKSVKSLGNRKAFVDKDQPSSLSQSSVATGQDYASLAAEVKKLRRELADLQKACPQVTNEPVQKEPCKSELVSENREQESACRAMQTSGKPGTCGSETPGASAYSATAHAEVPMEMDVSSTGSGQGNVNNSHKIYSKNNAMNMIQSSSRSNSGSDCSEASDDDGGSTSQQVTDSESTKKKGFSKPGGRKSKVPSSKISSKLIVKQSEKQPQKHIEHNVKVKPGSSQKQKAQKQQTNSRSNPEKTSAQDKGMKRLGTPDQARASPNHDHLEDQINSGENQLLRQEQPLPKKPSCSITGKDVNHPTTISSLKGALEQKKTEIERLTQENEQLRHENSDIVREVGLLGEALGDLSEDESRDSENSFEVTEDCFSSEFISEAAMKGKGPHNHSKHKKQRERSRETRTTKAHASTPDRVCPTCFRLKKQLRWWRQKGWFERLKQGVIKGTEDIVVNKDASFYGLNPAPAHIGSRSSKRIGIVGNPLISHQAIGLGDPDPMSAATTNVDDSGVDALLAMALSDRASCQAYERNKALPGIGQPNKPASNRARRKTVGEKELFSADLSLSVGSPSSHNPKDRPSSQKTAGPSDHHIQMHVNKVAKSKRKTFNLPPLIS